MSRVEEILSFWFGQPRDDKAYYEERHSLWFTPDSQFDQAIRDRFTDDYQLAAEQKLRDWQNTPRSGLALILLLDQFPRNMFRHDPRAFASDPLAREATTHLIDTGHNQQLLPVERMFIYLPLMHSEALADQRRSVTLFRQLMQEREYLGSLAYALKHLEIIERFGRFPHRNAPLGRSSTSEEQEFLRQPGSLF
jgi:uncharacterized protein (DUF924 family)